MIRIEFYGIPRARAGTEFVEVQAGSLGEVLLALASLPDFSRDCLKGNGLRPGYLACINGTEFTTNPQRGLQPGDTVLILSADVGG